MRSTSSGQFYRGWSFRTVNAIANGGGADRADFYDSAGNDTFKGLDTQARLTDGSSYDLLGYDFELARAIRSDGFSTGADSIELNSIDYVFDEIGTWAGP